MEEVSIEGCVEGGPGGFRGPAVVKWCLHCQYPVPNCEVTLTHLQFEVANACDNIASTNGVGKLPMKCIINTRFKNEAGS